MKVCEEIKKPGAHLCVVLWCCSSWSWLRRLQDLTFGLDATRGDFRVLPSGQFPFLVLEKQTKNCRESTCGMAHVVCVVGLWMAVNLIGYKDWLVSMNHFRHLIDVTPVFKMSCAITELWKLEPGCWLMGAGFAFMSLSRCSGIIINLLMSVLSVDNN